jgi:hypothetical protein
MQEWNTSEPGAIAKQQAAQDNLPNVLARAVMRVRGAIAAGGYALGPDGTIPDQVRDSVIAFTRWKLLLSLPEVNESMLSKSRKADYDDACKRFEAISQQKERIESPDGAPAEAPSGNWNSENKLVGRAHPVPRPSTQAPNTSQSPPYANPDPESPEDS